MENFTPQRLGDGDGTSNLNEGDVLTPDEIRRRRIEALDRVDNINYRPQPTIQQPVTTTSSTAIADLDRDNVPDDDEVDEELQAALALSLQDVTTPITSTSTNDKFDISTVYTTSNVPFENNNIMNDHSSQSITWKSTDRSIIESSSIVSVQEYQKILPTISVQPLQNIFTHHRLLWDDHLTTDSDKNRWISQGIDVRSGSDSNNNNSNNNKNQDSTQTETSVVTNNDGIELVSTSIMDIITSSHLPWGLVQQHGGPCGVLAAIQAELLRSLLFSNDSSGETLTTLNSDSNDPVQSNKQRKLPIRNALARAIAIVLCRAALTPSSIGNDSSKSNNKNESSDVVRIVLPSYVENRELTWQDLEPWYPTEHINEKSGLLSIYNIPIIGGPDTTERHLPNTLLSSTSTEQSESNIVTSKRQKVVLNDTEASSSSPRVMSSLNVRIDRMACIVEQFLLDESHCNKSVSTIESNSPLDYFRRPGGVLLLVLSLIASRTIETIREDFDDPVDTRLTGQFGHCSQELINLLLTGRAVSNVFDNTLSPSGDMICRGVQSRPVIGYLTQLEAMRYCEVGGYYKMPLFPIWVVGSTSHFTVLFGDPVALKESKSDILLDECRRAFKAVEGGEENGFIQTDQLTSVLKNLNIDVGGSNVNDETARIQTLAAALEVSGAGIILWDDFWKAASRLLTGASLETVLHDSDATRSLNSHNVDNGNEPPLLLSNFAANSDIPLKPEARRPTASVSSYSNYIESDEEMARRLAAEWDNVGAAGMLALSKSAESHVSSDPTSLMEVDQQAGAMGDEEYAQYLQRQYDSENNVEAAISHGEGGSVAAISGSPFPVLSDTDETASIPVTPTQTMFAGDDDFEDTKPAAQVINSTESLAFEQYGDTFSLYHYNGLRGGILTHFRLTRLTAEEAVGASISLNRTGVVSSHGSSGTQDLEDVVRTKWPSCSINWLGKTPPCID